MADNITVTSGTGVTIAADDNGGALHQWVKIEVGGDGSFVPVTTANGLPVQILSLPAFAAGSTVAITSLPDLGLNSSIKITSLPDFATTASVRITSLPAFALGSIISVSGLTSATVSIGAGSVVSVSGLTSASVSISNLTTTLQLVSGTTIAITSLPDLGLNSVVKITSLPDLGLNSAVKITSLPDLGLNSVVKITSLPDLGLNSSVKITSLPNFAPGQIISISGLTSATATVTNAGVFAVQVTSLPALAVGTIVSISNGAIISVSGLSISSVSIGANPNSWSLTSTYTAAQTNVVLKSEPSSTTALYITDIIFSNSSTEGNLSLIESRPNAAIKVKMETLYFRPYGGAVIGLRSPIILDTNSSLCMTSRSVTAHSVTVVGYRV